MDCGEGDGETEREGEVEVELALKLDRGEELPMLGRETEPKEEERVGKAVSTSVVDGSEKEEPRFEVRISWILDRQLIICKFKVTILSSSSFRLQTRCGESITS